MTYSEAIGKAMEGHQIRLPTWAASRTLIYTVDTSIGPMLIFTTGKCRGFIPLLDEKKSDEWIALPKKLATGQAK